MIWQAGAFFVFGIGWSSMHIALIILPILFTLSFNPASMQ